MIKKTNLFFFILLIMCLSFNIYAQETEPKQESEQKTEEVNEADQAKVLTNVPSDFGFYFGTEIIFSSLKKQAAPPIGTALNLGAEYEYKGIRAVSIIPSLDFSLFHYSLYKEKAYICEIENRTALTMSFLVDVPFLARFDLNPWTISIGGGLALFMRFGLLEPGIKPEETGAEGLSAVKETKEINKYFWQKGRFIYPSLRFKTEYTMTSGWKAGVQLKAYLPISNLWDNLKNKSSDGLIVQVGIVLHPAVKR
ncbi:hypothetical protein [Treponema putidum]|uniref:Outer membrane protein with beta-barrel domain n=1 Tax=Treponema putidum TaxID=221027 RepID=A0AAE9MUE6_9SPIR|nr:hypothetical protein [Treponema putidum]AIN94129.1 hypothetical protein JO40_08445 [Treponema putidum]TWI79584.1 hypothetical protein JM98_00014 [Treponema putidum]UTY28075.1 hypothetical protein E4N76_03095 [Treponema putidum]UTY30574.1 hypothetical protein E4N75_02695 [Treponema putidum]UTY32981.1 hypothetical protein E4N74_02390 [Treponema putidum]